VKSAVEAGELNAQIDSVSAAVRERFAKNKNNFYLPQGTSPGPVRVPAKGLPFPLSSIHI
jgi:hypothetical protein